ncbi:MAG: DEAD/DEAH box helicase family protein [Deltaproteobacteria bacterium]|nr:DEAD/DEAH box helicase family protein [Deltaproteobacteria bacterium]
MELNSYQTNALRDLAAYLEAVDAAGDYAAAYRKHWAERDVKIGLTPDCLPPYKDNLKGTPHVCFKVPTGGGKTFLACASVKVVLDAMCPGKARVVVWLVPSNAILEQTVRALSNPRHPYRQRLERDFSGRVEVYTKEDLLSGRNFNPAAVAGQLSVCVLSYDSLRSKKKDGRKVYQQNSALEPFVKTYATPETLVEGVDDTALIQALNQLAPVVIVDESHNARSDLSVEMLRNLNPAFVLDLTATPRENSNIISFVDARALKKESMVKLPVVVYNRRSKKDVIVDAIQLRGKLEAGAKAAEASGGPYIRPIVLFQAQSRDREDAETFEKLKEKLIEAGIPKEWIAIKTSEINELKDVDLLSSSCSIRYIITVNALKEGWDCPFAYILATLANRNSKVDVEQIVGRVLRQPYARKHAAPLNLSYVLTCSAVFFDTLENIVAGLNRAGFSKKDVRVSEPRQSDAEDGPDAPPPAPPEQLPLLSAASTEAEELQGVDFAEVGRELERQAAESAQGTYSPAAEDMIRQATAQSADYEDAVGQGETAGLPDGVLGEKMNQFFMRPAFQAEAEALELPQFFVKTEPDLFHEETYARLNKENLSAGFTLKNEDTRINFSLSAEDLYAVDLAADGEAVPKYKKMTETESRHVRGLIAGKPEETKKALWADVLHGQIERKNSMNCVESRDLRAYVRRIVDNMSGDTLASLANSPSAFAWKIQDKVESLLDVYREKCFQDSLDTSLVFCRSTYRLPKFITPADTGGSLDKSLYASEASMNNFERELIAAVSALDNVAWWHKIAERKEYSFCINGFINHYPDFLVLTASGKIVVIEAKGDDRDNSDSAAKLRLGRKWADKAGDNYRYFMVFQNRELRIDGAYALDEFMGIVGKL